MKRTFKVMVIILVLSSFTCLLLGSSQNLTAEGKRNLRSAKMHLSGQRYEKALPLFEAVLDENPHHIEALESVAGIYYDVKKDYNNAQKYYTKTIEEINSIFAEYEDLKKTDEKAAGKFYKKNIKKEKLEDKLDQVTKLNSSCWTKMFLFAQELFDNEEIDKAIIQFEALYEIAPDSSKTLKMLAYAYNKKEDNEKSLEYMIRAAELDINDDIARTQIANTLYEKGEYEKSIEWYKKAAEINSQNIDNHFNMALAYSKLKNNEGAYEAFKKVVEINPDNLDAILNISNYAAKTGNIDESINYLKKAVEIDPENTDIISFLSYKLAQEKKYEELLKYAEIWHKLDPTSTEAQQLINLAKQKK
ncbi:MAG: tetratricopeptide repeat protein [Candidatus Cloacimonetes bacterium]|nr:tetratricopeptide repeat protein [Candidatus Cloacimonadota bacterium]